MSTLAKVLVVVNVLLVATFLGSVANFLGNEDTAAARLRTERAQRENERAAMQQQIQELTKRGSDQLATITQVQTERNDANAARDAAIARADQLGQMHGALADQHQLAQRSMDRMTASIKGLRDANAALQSENATLTSTLQSVRENRDQTQQRLAAAETSLENAQGQTQQKSEVEEQLKRKNRELETAVAWYQERFPGVTPALLQPDHSGRVIAANAASNVYVISLGAEDGVKPGFRYTVARGERYVGTIQIDDVQSKKASGFAIQDLTKAPIQQGDVVVPGR